MWSSLCSGRAVGWLILFACLSVHAQTELQKAADELKIQTRDLGLRSDSAKTSGGTKAAARQWHGRIYENFRNDFLDAVPHQVAQRGGTKSVLRRNQFGLNVSGPLVIPKLYDGRRKTFFSFSYEGVRDHTARSYLQTLATAPERSGDFSQTVDQSGAFLPVYDPLSTQENPAFDPTQPVTRENLKYFRTPFPDNRIEANRLSPVAFNTLEYYPAPNASAGPFSRNNYFLVTPATNNHDGIIFRVDHTIRERHRISVNYNYTRGLNGAAAMLPTAANPASADRRTHDPWGNVEYTFTKSPQVVNKFRLAMEIYLVESGEQGEPDYAGKFGLRGASPLAFPTFSFSPYVGMGRSYPRSRSVWNYFNWYDTLSVKRGKHTLTLSAEVSRNQDNVFENAYPAGKFQFTEGLTSLPGITGTGHSFASFLLGLADYAEKSYVLSPSYMRGSYASVAFKEQYQAFKSLTVTVGLSVWSRSPRIEKYDRQSSVDLSVVNPANGRPGAMVVAGKDGVGRAFQPRVVNFDPSASVAWNVMGDSNTVLRASYSYTRGSYSNSSTFGTQAFNAAPVYLSANSQLEPAVRLSNGLPPLARPLPDLRREALNDTNADLFYTGRTRPAYHSASVSVERQLPFSTMVTGSASANNGRDVYAGNSVFNVNAIPIAALAYRDQLYDEAFSRPLRPYPQYKSLNLGGTYPVGRYRSESAYINIEKRATAGLSMSFRYSWSSRRDDYSASRQEYLNRRNEWSVSPYYTSQGISFTYMYELPLGRGKAFLHFSDWRRHLVDGWSASGTSTYSNGAPLSLRPQFNNTGGVIPNLRVNIAPGVSARVPDPGPDGWFNPAAFDQPADFTLGNAARAYRWLTGPASQNHDLTASKRFPLAGDKTLEFNAVALNFLNHANWNAPDTVIGPLSAPNVNAGKIIGSTGGRVLQLGLKLSF